MYHGKIYEVLKSQMRRFRSLAAYQIHCSHNTGEFEAVVQIQFGLLDLGLLTKWILATLLSQAAYCCPQFLHSKCLLVLVKQKQHTFLHTLDAEGVTVR